MQLLEGTFGTFTSSGAVFGASAADIFAPPFTACVAAATATGSAMADGVTMVTTGSVVMAGAVMGATGGAEENTALGGMFFSILVFKFLNKGISNKWT